jgi:hypothetical protein
MPIEQIIKPTWQDKEKVPAGLYTKVVANSIASPKD